MYIIKNILIMFNIKVLNKQYFNILNNINI